MGSEDGLHLATAAVDAYLGTLSEGSGVPAVDLGPQLEHLKQLYEAESAAAWALQASHESVPYIAMVGGWPLTSCTACYTLCLASTGSTMLPAV
jgi:hypothetical protein